MRRIESAAHRIGRRGGVLLLLALVDFAYGASLVSPSAESLSSASIMWREHYAPVWAWGLGWLVVGAILVAGAIVRRDAFAYAAAIGWKIIWSLTTLASWAFGNVDRGWVSTFIWGVVAGMIGVISGWPEPVVTPDPTEG